jgi:hypothetical protein
MILLKNHFGEKNDFKTPPPCRAHFEKVAPIES